MNKKHAEISRANKKNELEQNKARKKVLEEKIKQAKEKKALLEKELQYHYSRSHNCNCPNYWNMNNPSINFQGNQWNERSVPESSQYPENSTMNEYYNC